VYTFNANDKETALTPQHHIYLTLRMTDAHLYFVKLYHKLAGN